MISQIVIEQLRATDNSAAWCWQVFGEQEMIASNEGDSLISCVADLNRWLLERRSCL